MFATANIAPTIFLIWRNQIHLLSLPAGTYAIVYTGPKLALVRYIKKINTGGKV